MLQTNQIYKALVGEPMASYRTFLHQLDMLPLMKASLTSECNKCPSCPEVGI